MFVAVVPPAGVVEHLDEFWSVRRESAAEAAAWRWTLPEQWHLTLAFLAEVPDRAYDDLVERLARAAAKRRPMTAHLTGAGAFPDAGRAKVLWAGCAVEDAEELRRLATGCRAAASRAGIDVGGDRFRPHLTLARSRHPQEATRWLRVGETYAGPAWGLDTVSLVASHLGEGPRKRPHYEVIEEFRLRAVPLSKK